MSDSALVLTDPGTGMKWVRPNFPWCVQHVAGEGFPFCFRWRRRDWAGLYVLPQGRLLLTAVMWL